MFSVLESFEQPCVDFERIAFAAPFSTKMTYTALNLTLYDAEILVYDPSRPILLSISRSGSCHDYNVDLA